VYPEFTEFLVREGIDFFPLTVDYRENTYAPARFPAAFSSAKGGRLKRKS
jgi:polyribonucleotide nucleotidyltransferase